MPTPKERISGLVLRVDRAPVDTDLLCPARFCKRITKVGYDDALFADWRSSPDCPLNSPHAKCAKVLVARGAFGIGSSREHAVWALRDFGIEAVVAPEFGDIFAANCVVNGLLPIRVDITVIVSLMMGDVALAVDVDIKNETLTSGLEEFQFELDHVTSERFLRGWDMIDATLSHDEEITEFEGRRPAWMPVVSSPAILSQGKPLEI